MAAAALAAPLLALADLPVHCLHHQIAGAWTFYIGPPTPSPSTCGAHTPGEVRDALPREVPFANATLLDLQLELPDLVTASGRGGASTSISSSEGVGWWSMVYDEGFEVRLGGKSYFAFSSVAASVSGFMNSSNCSTTAIGWYHDFTRAQDQFGCYYAVQKSAPAPHSLLPRQTAAGAAPDKAHSDALKYAALPREWDWRDVDGVNYVPPARSQGSCGGCYAIATVAMLESRVAIASGGRDRPALSVQEVLSCSPYSQGCLGGFPYLVGKYLADVGVVSEACFPFRPLEDAQPRCEERCSDGRRWRASDYRYVGGGYGSCSEVSMMREIFEHGPIVAGFEATADLYSHRGGAIFSSPPSLTNTVEATAADDHSDRQRGNVSFFERTNHAVLVVGWGMDDASGAKYWWAQNTWSDTWGVNGYFRIARGSDDSAFESMAVAVDVEGALPLQRLRLREVTDDDDDFDGELIARSEARRRAALRRWPVDTALKPDAQPPPSPSPRYALVEEPRDELHVHVAGRATASSSAGAAPPSDERHFSLLDALAHWRYGGW